MSSLPPPSFIDDSASIHQRLPPENITHWLHDTSTSSDTTSAYTGSYIDDGADLLPPRLHHPGFGAIDARFYKQHKRRDGEGRGPWNEDIQRAVGGDIGRSLEGLRGVQVRRGDGERRGKKSTVTMPLPRRWGTIVIRDGERVIVVDEEGEFDSGVKEKEMESGERKGKWIKAATVDSVLVDERDYVREEKRRRKKMHAYELVEVLTPITESEHEEVPMNDKEETDVMSPSGFFMTGGSNGWPSPKPSSVAYSSAKSLSKSKKASLPGSWPSPPPSPTKGVAVSETSTDTSSSKASWGKAPSHASRGSRRSHASSSDERNNMSTKTFSAYKPVTVEDAPDTSSNDASISPNVDCQDNHQGSEGWGSGKRNSTSSKKSSEKSWKGAVDSWDYQHPPTMQTSPASRVKTASEASSRPPLSQSQQSHTNSETSWDGYERPKTESEVSVVGSGSEKSWPGTRVSSRHSHISGASRQHSQRSSRHGSQAGWAESEGWGGSQSAHVDGWGGRRLDHGSGIARSDIDETSGDEGWSSLKIRVKSRRASVDEWK